MTIKKSAEGHELAEDGSNYDSKAYENPAVTTDVCICRFHDTKVEVLLIKRKYPPFRDMWAIPGGFLNKDKEGLYECAMRELKEETGLTHYQIQQFGAYGGPKRDPRMHVVTVAYYAIVNDDAIDYDTIGAGDDAKEYGWFDIQNLPDMAFDHATIIEDLYWKLKIDVERGDTAFRFLRSEFTWSDIHWLYSRFIQMDASNLRKYIKSRFNIKKTGNYAQTRGRKAALLTYEKIS